MTNDNTKSPLVLTGTGHLDVIIVKDAKVTVYVLDGEIVSEDEFKNRIVKHT